jgi:hypothetical protein
MFLSIFQTSMSGLYGQNLEDSAEYDPLRLYCINLPKYSFFWSVEKVLWATAWLPVWSRLLVEEQVICLIHSVTKPNYHQQMELTF